MARLLKLKTGYQHQRWNLHGELFIIIGCRKRNIIPRYHSYYMGIKHTLDLLSLFLILELK